MNSIVVHYKELALKGRNRPWFVQHARPQPAEWRSPVSTSSRSGRSWAGSRSSSGRAPPGPRRATACGACSASPTSRTPAAARTTSTRWRLRSCATWAIGTRRRSACSARRSDKRFPFTSPQIEREVGGLHQGGAPAGTSISTQPALTHPHRDAAGPRVLFLRQGAGRGRPADRHGRPGRLSPVGRHRFAGRGVSDDAPRLLGAADPLSQLSDPVARVAGEGARDRRAADEASAAFAARAGAVRRAAAAGRCSACRRSCAS